MSFTSDFIGENLLDRFFADPNEELYSFDGKSVYNWDTKSWEPMTEEQLQRFEEKERASRDKQQREIENLISSPELNLIVEEELARWRGNKT